MQKPIPAVTADTREFWDACARGELVYQVCPDCASVQFYPRRHCAACQAVELEWRRSAGLGAVYSHTTVYRAPTPAFKAEVPYVIALVNLDEGFRMMVNILGCDPAAVAIGSRMRIVFRAAGGGVTLPQGELV
jgi:uncharacterized OB-fold protein